MSYTSGSHTVFHHRYHIVWITKYRYKVLEGALRERIRTIIRQVCRELGVQIVSGVLSREHVHMFVEIPPHIAVATSCGASRDGHRIGCVVPDLRKRYWGRHFWARGYFSTTSGNITDNVILQVSSGARTYRRQPVLFSFRSSKELEPSRKRYLGRGSVKSECLRYPLSKPRTRLSVSRGDYRGQVLRSALGPRVQTQLELLTGEYPDWSA